MVFRIMVFLVLIFPFLVFQCLVLQVLVLQVVSFQMERYKVFGSQVDNGIDLLVHLGGSFSAKRSRWLDNECAVFRDCTGAAKPSSHDV